jgi:hypothetical protein
MTISAAVLKRLGDLQLAPEAMAEVLSIIADIDVRRSDQRSKGAERQARYRQRHSNASHNVTSDVTVTQKVTSQSVTSDVTVTPLARVDDSSSSTEISGKIRKNICPISPEKTGKREQQRAVEDAFSEFWKAYPRRVGDNPRKTALASYERAIASGAVPETILAGTRRLAAKHPTPTPFVPMAATWLNQERWEDGQQGGEPAARVTTIAEDYADDPEFLRANGFM